MRRGLGAARTALLAIGCALAGCAGSGGGGGGTPAPACRSQVPGNPISSTRNVQPIYDRSCALSGCHLPPTLNGGLDLSASRSYSQTVRVSSQQIPRIKRVKPADPDNSYLFQKIIGTPGIAGVLMPQGCPGTPLNGATCLTPDEKDAIRTWILECAPKN
jgi:hypothetical protein